MLVIISVPSRLISVSLFRGASQRSPLFVSFYKVEPLKSWQARWLARAPLSFYS